MAYPEKQLYAHPLSNDHGPDGYWGIPCHVAFEHEERRVTHRGLVVLSGPMCTAMRWTRATQLRALRQALREIQAKIGQPRYRSVDAVQKRANTQLSKSPAGKFMRAEAYADEHGQVCLRWWVDRYTLWQAMQPDGRYLLVTNDWSLSPRCIIEKLESLDVIETRCWDGSRLYRIVPVDEEQAALLDVLAHILADLRLHRWPHPLLPVGSILSLALPPPGEWRIAP